MEGELTEVKRRIRQDLARGGWDPEERLLLEKGVEILEDLEGSHSLHSPSFRLGVIVGKLSNKIGKKGG